jgi:hypothetical protein
MALHSLVNLAPLNNLKTVLYNHRRKHGVGKKTYYAKDFLDLRISEKTMNFPCAKKIIPLLPSKQMY